MKYGYVSRLTTKRLSLYLRCLNELESAGVKTISSQEFADHFHLNSAQMRKDLAYFGEFGVRGVGYYVSDLKDHLIKILGLDKKYNIVIVGAGNLGRALADYAGFNTREFRVVALFDNAREKVGMKTKEGVPIHHVDDLDEIIKKEKVDIAVIAVPAHTGQWALDRIMETGIKAILNFVPTRLKIPKGVEVNTVDLKIQMERLAFHLTDGWKKTKKILRKKIGRGRSG
ncbi:MAG: redox-sensing transcriptional repressor Rex [Acidobacteriota bacterium]